LNLKDEYNKAFVESLANRLSTEASSFDKDSFVNGIINKSWEERELKDRVRHIAQTIYSHLDTDFADQIEILKKVAPHYNGLPAFVFPDFVEQFGLEDFKTSKEAMEIFTQQSTAEFAIRPFIEKYKDQAMSQILIWSKSKNHHLRRLASEGTRPRLPWASPLREFIKNPKPSLPILENLKNDDSEYVRKSVNDISKDHPELVLKLAKSWYGNSTNTDWIVKHGLRTLLKRGDKNALAIFGLNDSTGISTSPIVLSDESIKIGHFIHFAFEVINTTSKERAIRLEYRIDFVKANGSLSGKIFQLSEFNLKAKSKKSFKRKQWFKQLTTRIHYPGKHRITLIVNGDPKTDVTLNLLNH
jgi:3-methyladenine DNA glycosylase AlkC